MSNLRYTIGDVVFTASHGASILVTLRKKKARLSDDFSEKYIPVYVFKSASDGTLWEIYKPFELDRDIIGTAKL